MLNPTEIHQCCNYANSVYQSAIHLVCYWIQIRANSMHLLVSNRSSLARPRLVCDFARCRWASGHFALSWFRNIQSLSIWAYKAIVPLALTYTLWQQSNVVLCRPASYGKVTSNVICNFALWSQSNKLPIEDLLRSLRKRRCRWSSGNRTFWRRSLLIAFVQCWSSIA